MKCWNCWTSIATRRHPHLSGQAVPPHHLPPSSLHLFLCLSSVPQQEQQQLPFIAGSLWGCAAAALYFSQSTHFHSPSSIFSVSGLFLPCTMSICLCICVCVCVCESRFCVQVRSFNFDLCFRLFCVAFVDFCHLNRNFYFPHVSRHAQTPQQQQPSPVFVLPALFLGTVFMNACPGGGIGNWRARLANWISFLPDEHLKLTSTQPGLVLLLVRVVWPGLGSLVCSSTAISYTRNHKSGNLICAPRDDQFKAARQNVISSRCKCSLNI